MTLYHLRPMSWSEHSERFQTRRWRGHVSRQWLVVGATAIVFAGLWVAGAVAAMPALIGFAVVACAAAFALDSPASPPARRDHDLSPAAHDRGLTDSLISAFPEPVVVLDGADNVIAFNPGAKFLAPALRTGEPLARALRMPEVLDALRQTRTLGAAQRVEFSQRVPLERWYEANIIAIATGGAAARESLLLTFQDLTRLRQVEEMRADFVANASHELRTPLAALSGFIDTLRGAARDDPVARDRFLGIMQAQAQRMARLIDDLLSLSRIELNAHVRPAGAVDLMSVLRQVVDGLQTLAQDRDVEVMLSLSNVGILVPGDRDELISLFENLVENALKYAASGRRVEIELGVSQPSGVEVGTDAQARVVVRDYGPGIAAKHLPRLTERFYRVDATDSRAQGGTGLGLALVKHILNRHRGRLTIESTVGQGATFTVYLPLHVERPEKDT
ncbi:MAG: ATP-binding protein [Xanthobacteraceae bacterium]